MYRRVPIDENDYFSSGSDGENSTTALPWTRGRGDRPTPVVRRHLVKTRSAGVIRLTTTTCNGDWPEKRAPVVRPHTSDGRRRSLPTSAPSTSVGGAHPDANDRGGRKPEESSRKTVKWNDMCRPKTAPNGLGQLWKDGDARVGPEVRSATTNGGLPYETSRDFASGISETIREVPTPPSSDDGSSSQESSSHSPRDYTALYADVALNQDPSVDTEVVPHEDAPGEIRRLPQWKRDLMIEAPPSVYTSREPIKVSVVMSKLQRQRELDQLVEVNVSDVKALAIRERVRKMRARMNVCNTVDTIQHVIAALKATVDRQ